MIEFECLKKIGMNSNDVNKRVGNNGLRSFRKRNRKKKRNKKKSIKFRGVNGYKLYLKTKHWKEFRTKYIKNYLDKNYKNYCYCCNQDNATELHHIRYNNLFNEDARDIIFVCRECHEKIHTMILNEDEITLKNAHNVLRGLMNTGI